MPSATPPLFANRLERMLFYAGVAFLVAELTAQCSLPLGTMGMTAALSAEALLWVAAVFLFLSAAVGNRMRLYRSGMEKPLLLVAIWLAVSVALPSTQHKAAALRQSIQWLDAILLFFLMFHVFAHYLNPRYVLALLAALGVINAAYAVAQHRVVFPGLIAAADAGDSAVAIPEDDTRAEFLKRLHDAQPPGPFVSPNDLGCFLAMTGVLLWLLMLGDWRRGSRARALAGGAGVALIAYALLLSDSKGGMAAALIAGLLATLGWWRRRTRAVTWMWALGLAVAILASLAVALGPAEPFSENAKTLAADSLPGKAWQSLLIRFQYWQAAGRMWLDNAAWGVGARNYADHFSRYKIAEGEETVLAHNNYLEWIASYGSVGLMLGMAVFIGWFHALGRTTARLEQYTTGRDQLLFPLGAALAALLFGGLILGGYDMTVSREQPNAALQELFVAGAAALLLAFAFWRSRPMDAGREYSSAWFGMFGMVAAFSVHGLVDYGAVIAPLLQVAAVAAAGMLALRGPEILWQAEPGARRVPLRGAGVSLMVVILFVRWLIPSHIHIEEGLALADANRHVTGFARQAGIAHLEKGGDWFFRNDSRVWKAIGDYHAATWNGDADRLAEDVQSEAFRKAEAAYREIVRIQPADNSGYECLGRLYLQLAEVYHQRGGQAVAEDARRQCAVKCKETAEALAIPALEAAVERYPSKPVLHQLLGRACELAEFVDKTREQYLTALDLDGRQFHDRLKLGEDRQRLQDWLAEHSSK